MKHAAKRARTVNPPTPAPMPTAIPVPVERPDEDDFSPSLDNGRSVGVGLELDPGVVLEFVTGLDAGVVLEFVAEVKSEPESKLGRPF